MKNKSVFLNSDDKSILLDLAAGHKACLEMFYRKHAGKVLSFCRKKGLGKDQSEDVCQIVFMQLYRKSTQYKPEFEPLAWLFVITKSELRDYLKKQKLELPLEDANNTGSTEPNFAKIEDKNEVHSLLQKLPEREKEVLKMHYLDQMTYTEIATALNLKEPSLRKIVSRSLQFLSQTKGKHS